MSVECWSCHHKVTKRISELGARFRCPKSGCGLLFIPKDKDIDSKVRKVEDAFSELKAAVNDCYAPNA